MKNLSLKTAVAFAVFIGVAGYFLWQEHSAHIAMAVPYLPYLLILLCPIMHIFMHHGHGHGRGGDVPRRRAKGDETSTDQSSKTDRHPRHGSLPDRERRHD